MLSGDVRRLGEGNLQSEVSGRDRADEIGDLAGAIDLFRAAAIDRRASSSSSSTRPALREDPTGGDRASGGRVPRRGAEHRRSVSRRMADMTATPPT